MNMFKEVFDAYDKNKPVPLPTLRDPNAKGCQGLKGDQGLSMYPKETGYDKGLSEQEKRRQEINRIFK